MKDALLAAVVHDVKNQLAELALRLERRGDSAEEAAIAFAVARRLTGLLLLQRAQAGELKPSIDSACPADLLQELTAEYRMLYPRLEISCDAMAAPAFWFYDEALLRLALGNALHNACRHANSQVSLGVHADVDALVFAIADDGPGFPPDLLGADALAAPRPASQAGTGLGLYLAARIAALHENLGRRGEVRLGNDGGAIFLLQLP